MENETKQIENNNGNENEVEIDLGELFLVLGQHWWQIVVAVVLAAAIGLMIAALWITPQYSSTSILYVLSRSTSITSYTDIQVGSSLTSDYVEVVAGRPVLDQVAYNLGLDLEYGEMRSKVSVSNPADSRMLEITVKDADPDLAKLIADEVAVVASAYISQKMDQDAPEIIQYGYVNSTRSSPSYRRYTVLGAVLGLVLAIAVIWIVYLANDSIITPEELEEKTGMRVLGSLPMEEEELNEPASKKQRKRRSARKRNTSKKKGKTNG